MMRSRAGRKILFFGALGILAINAAKNIQSLRQLAGGRAPTVLMDGEETVATLIALFIILGAAIRDARFRAAWFLIISNELLALFAVSIFGNGSRLLPASAILLGSLLLVIGAVFFMRARKAVFIVEGEPDEIRGKLGKKVPEEGYEDVKQSAAMLKKPAAKKEVKYRGWLLTGKELRKGKEDRQS